MITKIEPTDKSVKIKIIRDYLDLGYNLYAKTFVMIHPGLTVLVGCNGAGKSTLIKQIRGQIHKNKETIIMEYNDFTDGREIPKGYAMLRGQVDIVASLMMSSEGEALHYNIGQRIQQLGYEIRQKNPKNVWFFMDAADSGLSIDYIDDIKDFCGFVQELHPEINFYIIVAANEYEMARESSCLDVNKLNYHTFPTYDSYRNFILASRKYRDALGKKKTEKQSTRKNSKKSEKANIPDSETANDTQVNSDDATSDESESKIDQILNTFSDENSGTMKPVWKTDQDASIFNDIDLLNLETSMEDYNVEVINQKYGDFSTWAKIQKTTKGPDSNENQT